LQSIYTEYIKLKKEKMTDKKRIDIETVKAGMANGISLQLAEKGALTDSDKQTIIHRAAEKFGEFLTALGVDWENDPNSNDTPMRVAKAYVNDLWAGRYDVAPSITAFPSDGYDGIVQESNIPIISMCSHHHQLIKGVAHVAYIPSKDGKVIGLSKLNRIVEHFARRGAIQEQLTIAIHNATDTICEDNNGVAVMINATHNCVSCRGTKHQGASMQTNKISGGFLESEAARAEFYKNIELSPKSC
jgi:GTP cyclohydrolase I